MRLVVTTALVCLLFVPAGTWASEVPEDAIVGIWLTETNDGFIKIDREGERYRGRIVGAPLGTRDDPDARDVKNPDPSLRDRKLQGLTILGNFKFNGKRWVDGWIYDPDVGKKYKSNIKLKRADRLQVRGYIGTPLLGRSQVWTRVSEDTPGVELPSS